MDVLITRSSAEHAEKEKQQFRFVAKECPILNLLQGSSPCSLSKPESNVHGSRVQVDLCPLADVG